MVLNYQRLLLIIYPYIYLSIDWLLYIIDYSRSNEQDNEDSEQRDENDLVMY